MYDKDPCADAWNKVQKLMKENETLKDKIKEALDILEKAFDDFGADGVAVCFNGGKDCIAMLHLTFAYFGHKFQGQGKTLQTVYIKEKDPFEEVETFIMDTEKRSG